MGQTNRRLACRHTYWRSAGRVLGLLLLSTELVSSRIYRTKWIESLKALHFEGHAFLPIPKEPKDGILDEEDRKYHQQLIEDICSMGGTFIQGREIKRIQWCQATINVREELYKIDKRLKSQHPYARNHAMQMSRIKGIFVISSAKIHNTLSPPSPVPSLEPSVVPSVPPTYHVDTKILSKYRKKYLQVIVVPK